MYEKIKRNMQRFKTCNNEPLKNSDVILKRKFVT